jgi:hypothetical protein
MRTDIVAVMMQRSRANGGDEDHDHQESQVSAHGGSGIPEMTGRADGRRQCTSTVSRQQPCRLLFAFSAPLPRLAQAVLRFMIPSPANPYQCFLRSLGCHEIDDGRVGHVPETPEGLSRTCRGRPKEDGSENTRACSRGLLPEEWSVSWIE